MGNNDAIHSFPTLPKLPVFTMYQYQMKSVQNKHSWRVARHWKLLLTLETVSKHACESKQFFSWTSAQVPSLNLQLAIYWQKHHNCSKMIYYLTIPNVTGSKDDKKKNILIFLISTVSKNSIVFQKILTNPVYICQKPLPLDPTPMHKWSLKGSKTRNSILGITLIGPISFKLYPQRRISFPEESNLLVQN